MKIPFWKMHGAGNDFILADDRCGVFPAHDRDWMARIASRRTGVGCDGIILIQPSGHAHFRMRFFNPDGGEAEMCGNGARCVAMLAHELGATPAEMTMETVAGDVGAHVLPGQRVRLNMPDPADWRSDGLLVLADGRSLRYDFVNTGVPHVVIRVDNLDTVAVEALGRAVREHPDFSPAGTNVNFVQVESLSTAWIRTYERGVEAETLACGTGVTAAALTLLRRGLVAAPVTVKTLKHFELQVNACESSEGFRGVTLTGPAAHVYEGTLCYEG